MTPVNDQMRTVPEAPDGQRRMTLNLGPQHPAMHGTLRHIVEMDGERIVKMEPEIGYLHSGFEKLAEYRNYNQGVVITDRMNYLSSLNNNIGLMVAVEELGGIEVTPRCAAFRVVLAELSRIADHIVCCGLQAMDLGAFSAMLWAWDERERAYDIFEAVSGARMTTSFARVGGMPREIPAGFDDMVRKYLKTIVRTLDDMENILYGNSIFEGRVRGIGILSKDECISFGVTGPILRAVGVEYDIRKARPYLGYEQYDFELITEKDGDLLARFKVRMREIRESMKIIEQALDRMPDGPMNVEDPRVHLPDKEETYGSIEGLIYHFKNTMFGHGCRPAAGEIYSSTEVPNGELGWYLVSDGTERPWRWRVRSPSLYHHQTMPRQCEGRLLSDVVAILSSLNVIAGELDR